MHTWIIRLGTLPPSTIPAYYVTNGVHAIPFGTVETAWNAMRALRDEVRTLSDFTHLLTCDVNLTDGEWVIRQGKYQGEAQFYATNGVLAAPWGTHKPDAELGCRNLKRGYTSSHNLYLHPIHEVTFDEPAPEPSTERIEPVEVKTLADFEALPAHRRTEEQLDALHEAGELDRDGWKELHEGGWAHEDDVWTCSHCDNTYLNDAESSTTVRVRRGQEEWCEDCRDRDAFHCERSDEYYCDSHYSSVRVEGETVCYEAYSDELYHWDSDDSYHWEEEPEQEDDPRADYHGMRRSWNVVGRTKRGLDNNYYVATPASVTRPNGSLSHDDLLGTELEVEANDREDLEIICRKAGSLGILAEKDGSLDDDLGVELVGSPLSIQGYRKGPWEEMIKTLKGTAKGWDAGKDYGMHVSLNRVGVDAFTQGKFVCWFSINRRLCEIVAGRREVHWAKYVPKKVSCGREDESDKYEAAAIRSGKRIEVRIFRSTLKWESFLKNVQFVQAALDFCRKHGVRQLGQDHLFLEMVDASNRYRELKAFLRGKGFQPNGEKVNEQLLERAVQAAISAE